MEIANGSGNADLWAIYVGPGNHVDKVWSAILFEEELVRIWKHLNEAVMNGSARPSLYASRFTSFSLPAKQSEEPALPQPSELIHH